MFIKKKLILPGNNDVSAVLLNDEGEEYPVFLETLHNTIVFPTLLESGYTITSLPYGFVSKDGTRFEDLPTEQYNPTDIEMEQMYNSIGAKVDYDKIKSHIQITENTGVGLPPVNYTIHTREEFLKYLETLNTVGLDSDFYPINYFVAPEARFEPAEYIDANNKHYISIMENRRTMNLRKFHNLVRWLQSMHLIGGSPNPQDVLDGYFAWGVDGMKFVTINRHREQSAFRLRSNNKVAAPIIRKTQGFIDGAGNLLTPLNERDVTWKLPTTDPEYVQNMTRELAANDTMVQEFHAKSSIDITTLEGVQFNVRYSTDLLVVQFNGYVPIRVKSPVSISETIDMSLALPHNIDKLYEYCALRALAKYVYNIKKPRIRTSSYDALTVIGANPSTAIQYILTKHDLLGEQRKNTEEELPPIGVSDVTKFLEGKEIDETIQNLFEDIISGDFSIDSIEAGKRVESSINIDNLYCEMYAIRHVMGISVEEIYEKLRTLDPDAKSVAFSNGQIQHIIDVSPMRYSMNGYLRDVQNYDVQCADECNFFTYITMVAREVGVETCTRHVAAEMFMVNRKNKAVEEILNNIVAKYTERVNTMLVSADDRAAALRLKNVFALSRYFEIALKGTMTWSKKLGSTSEYVPTDLQMKARQYLETKIESLPVYCDFTTNSFSYSSLSFDAYCVNAYVTPEYVIPRGKSPILEVPFYTAWMDLNNTHPTVYAQLVGLNILPAGFESWSSRYFDQMFKQRAFEDLDNKDSLLYYYENAVKEVKEWPVTMDFHNVTHPIEYLNPGLYTSEEEDEDEEINVLAPTVLREGAPVIRFGVKRDITIDDYRDKLYPSAEVEEPDQFLRESRGHDIEAFMLLGNEIFTKMPNERAIPVTVFGASESIFVSDTQQIIHYTRLGELDPNKYPIINVYGRNWLIRSTNGKLWEARI